MIAPLFLAAILFTFSGFGRLLIASSRAPLKRTVFAEYFVGFLLYAAMFGAAYQSASSESQFLIVFAISLVGGLVAACYAASLRTVVLRFSTGVAVAIVLWGLSFIPANPRAEDPVNYAYFSAIAFHGEWLNTLDLTLGYTDFFMRLSALGALTRSPEVSVLWPYAVLLGTNATVATAATVSMLLASTILLADLLATFASLLVAIVLALGGVGFMNVHSALIGGQLNQAFVVLVISGTLWLWRLHLREGVRLVILALDAYLLASGYPEFFAALPLYVGCLAIVSVSTLRQFCQWCVALGVGTGLSALVTQGHLMTHLLEQSAARPGWSPLGIAQGSLPQAWVAILIGPPFRGAIMLAPVLTVAIFVLVIRRIRRDESQPSILIPVLIAGVFFGIAWSVLIQASPNTDYSAFKLGGWIGPGLALVAWVTLSRFAQIFLLSVLTLLVFVASFRAVGSLEDAAWDVAYLTGATRPTAWQLVGSGGDPPRCIAVAPSTRQQDVLRTIVESGAPRRGCTLEIQSSEAGIPPSDV